jgi:hypothetical protein
MGIAFAIVIHLLDLIPAAILLVASVILLRRLQNGATVLMLIGAALTIVVRLAGTLHMMLLSTHSVPSSFSILLSYANSIGYLVAAFLFALGLLFLARHPSLAPDPSTLENQ